MRKGNLSSSIGGLIWAFQNAKNLKEKDCVSETVDVIDELKKLKTKANQLERRNHMIFKYVKLSYNKIIVLEEKMEKLEKEKNVGS